MAENNSVITLVRRISLAQITSGAISTLPPVTHIALGDKGVDAAGVVIAPSESQTALNREVFRAEVDAPEYPVPTTARYTITVQKSELVGVAISEMALVDAQGRLCAIRNTLPKTKDSDEEFVFIFDDEF